MAKTKAPHNEKIEERLCEATMAILQDVPAGTLNIVLVNKALFYADLYCLREEGDTITGSTYLGLPQGPVVASYERRIVEALAKRGWATQIEQGASKPLKVERPQAAFPELTQQHRKILTSIAKQIYTFTSSNASDLSHQNPAWKKAFREGLEAGKPAAKLNMVLALQQLPMDDDPWLRAPFTSEEQAAVDAADSEAGEPWV